MIGMHVHALEVAPALDGDGQACQTFKSFGPQKVDGDCDYCRAGIPMVMTYEWRGVSRPAPQ